MDWARRNALRVLVLVLVTVVAALVGLAVLSGTKPRPAATGPGTAGRTAEPTATASTTSTATEAGTARGSAGGYDATVHVLRIGAGATAPIVLQIDLTTESTPASAPTAQAQLRGAGGIKQSVKLELSGAGQWTSNQLLLRSGRYTLTTRFDRQGGPLTIGVSILVP